jgi:3-oxoacyl-[acyl-carrier-protein] synthase-3
MGRAHDAPARRDARPYQRTDGEPGTVMVAVATAIREQLAAGQDGAGLPAHPYGQVFITGCGAFLPGEPVGNDEIEDRLGRANGRPSRLKARVLAANGIEQRHYALDAAGNATMLNEELAARAVLGALAGRGLSPADVGMLAVGTTQGDLPVPGFASMVHGRLGGGPMELLSAAGVCGSSMAAFKAAAASVRLGEHDVAVAAGSELVSRTLRGSRFAAAGDGAGVELDAEFLRWMLSDGAGAVVLEPRPRAGGPSLRVDWVHLASHAHEHPTCMYSGMRGGGTPAVGATWLDRPTVAEADAEGLLRLRQDTRLLPALVRLGVEELVRLTRRGLVDPAGIDHMLCHYSSEHFRGEIGGLLRATGLAIPAERWFTNLRTRGNTGAASIFVMLEECWSAGRFRPGDRVLLMVPESGRFSVAFAHLTCVAPGTQAEEMPVAASAPAPVRTHDREPPWPRHGPPWPGHGPAPAPGPVPEAGTGGSPLGEPREDDPDVVRWTLLELALVWTDFERMLARVPIVRRIEDGQATLEEYKRLLVNLRQQVMEGGRWIARAASNVSIELFALRSAFILHAGEEHRDYQLLEHDYCAVGGSIEEIRSARPNVGSEALSAFMFHQAGQPDPLDLLGAMFVIEGLGMAKALGWARRLQEQLGLSDDQVSFLRYHGVGDEEHFELLRGFLRAEVVDRAVAARIVKTAKVVARLYALQLEEIDNA